MHRLTEALGLIPGVDEETLSPEVRPRLRALGVRSGRFALFMPALMKARAGGDAGAAVGAGTGACRCRRCRTPRWFRCPAHQPDWPPGFAAMAGWIEAGPILLRLDIAEKVAGELGYRSRRGPAALPSGLASRFAVKPDMLPAVLRQLGFRVLPAAALVGDQQGPPAPAMLMPLRRRRPLVPGSSGSGRPGQRTVRRPGGIAKRRCPIADTEDQDWQRLDKWLWCARVMRARTDCADWWRKARSGSTASRPASRTRSCGWGTC